MSWEEPIHPKKRAEAVPAAAATVQSAEALLDFARQHLMPSRIDGDGWTGARLAALCVAASWQATKDVDAPMPVEDYVAMIRAHANTIEDLLL